MLAAVSSQSPSWGVPETPGTEASFIVFGTAEGGMVAPVNVTLLAKKVFADVMKLRILRAGEHSGLPRWDLNAITGILIREGG